MSNIRRARPQLVSAALSPFFVNTVDGRIATRDQLDAASLVDTDGRPQAPWHAIQGTGDASTLWYALLRRKERGVFMAMLCLRHSPRQASMTEAGWEEVAVEEIGV